MLKLLVVVASLFIGGGMAMGAPGEADGYFAAEEAGSGASLEEKRDEEAQEVSEAPVHRIDDLTLMYLTHEVYLDPYVSCRPKVLGERSYVACWNETYSGRSPLNFWEYAEGDFLALNDPARALAQGKFAREKHIGEVPLPLPLDIDLDQLERVYLLMM
ncbi:MULTISPECIES: hypothetical protein [Pseudomonas aeruginosa group]|uniref:Uncharacterized protein n=1 Tax=Pseudomonas paraeruginosa TaxID=2994495 RepID=A0A2R3J1X4_9PSED|nr:MULTISPECIES: hypothetical protein [Pseudomonas aeruginosa group]AVK08179.1 hypothetical protein CSB93_6156 [Pseudomonas paraeruginosa]AWE92392.1 hypothetical protein CSC28_4957 [Pseudomonas paraeruginosa]KSD74337.2 hypothetical protein AO903_07805 [Pseudomonas aeruginosa]MCT9629562.1 hypothetical protein [Pseudomonas aeruginosa]MCW8028966.1 hypothetical protein [Pseudomonas aeruginosa]